jgi:hypothetical protein
MEVRGAPSPVVPGLMLGCGNPMQLEAEKRIDSRLLFLGADQQAADQMLG